MGDLCRIFPLIRKDTSDPTAVADKFMNAKYPVNVVRLELTRLLLDSSGFRDKLPDYMVQDHDVLGISNWIDQRVNSIHIPSIPVNNKKYFRRCTSFFERVFMLDWNTFANGGRFDTWFNALLDELSQCEPVSLHALSFAVKLKLITAYLRGVSVHNNPGAMSNVKAYCADLLPNTIFYKTIQCQISAAAELYEWIKIDPSFATDHNLKMVVWCLRMGKTTLTCHALSIIYALLRMEHLRDRFTLLTRKLVGMFESMCLLANGNILEWICRCCEFICKYHRNAITDKLTKNMLDILFDQDRARAKSVAGFWISSFFDPSCHRTNIRIILRFLNGKKTECWQMLVDSIIDDYPLIIDWKRLVAILLDEDEVPEETRLTSAEKGQLIALMSYGIAEAVTGLPPEYRAANCRRLTAEQRNNYSQLVTEALMPNFWHLFNLEYPDNECVQVALMNCVKFCNHAIMERNMLANIIRECGYMFERSRQPHCYQTIIDVLRAVVGNVEDDEIADSCDNAFRSMREFCESKFIRLVYNYFKHPDMFENPNSENMRGAELTLVRILAVNRVMILDRSVAYCVPVNLLWREMAMNAVLLSLLYVSCALIGQYACHTADIFCQIRDERQTLPQYEDNVMCEVHVICKLLAVKLKELCPWSNASQAAFFNLVKVVESLRTLQFSRNTWNLLLPQNAQRLIAGYVAFMVWQEDPKWGPALELKDATRLWILDGFLNLIKWKVLPLHYAYDAMSSFHKKPAATEKPLREFIARICASEEQSVVVDWLVQWVTFVFRFSPQGSAIMMTNFVELIFPIRMEMQNILCNVILKGVEFAVGKRGQAKASSNHKFLDVLISLGECLDASKKTYVEKHLIRDTYNKNVVKILESFIKRMKKRTRKVGKAAESDGSEPSKMSSPILSSQRSSYIAFDESLPVWSPSSIDRSSSVLADESDVDADTSVSDMRLQIRSFDGDLTRHLVGILPADIFENQTDDASSKPSIPARELDTGADPSKSTSGEIGNDISANSSATSTALDEILLNRVYMRSSGALIETAISSTGVEERDRSVPSTLNAPDAEENPLHTLADLSLAAAESASQPGTIGVGNAAKPSTKTKTSNTPIKVKPQFLREDELKKVLKYELANAESIFVFGGEESNFAKNLSISSSEANQPDAQTESTARVSKNVNELLQGIRIPSQADHAVIESPSVSACSGEALYTARTPSKPTALLKEPDTRTENTSQVLRNVNELLQGIQIPSPADHAVVESPSVTVSSGEALEMVGKPSISATLSEESNTQTENTSQVLQNVNELLQGMQMPSSDDHTIAKSPPIAAASGETIDTVAKSSPTTWPKEPDTPAENTSTSLVLDNVNELLQGMQIPDDPVSTSPTLSESSGEAAYIAKIPLPHTRADEPVAQTENTSEVFENVNELLNMQAPATDDHPTTESSASRFSGDGSNSSTSPRSAIAQTDTTYRVLDNVNELLNLQGDSTDETKSTTESSGEFAVDDIFRNRSIFSDSPKESDEADNASQTFGSVDEMMKNLEPSKLDEYAVAKSPSESDISEFNVGLENQLSTSAESGGRISDVVKNFLRVSLSNPETEPGESSSSAFGESPQKKKRKKD